MLYTMLSWLEAGVSLPKINMKALSEWNVGLNVEYIEHGSSLGASSDQPEPIGVFHLMPRPEEEKEQSPWRVIGQLEGAYQSLETSVKNGNAYQIETREMLRNYFDRQEEKQDELVRGLQNVQETVLRQNGRIGSLEQWKQSVEGMLGKLAVASDANTTQSESNSRRQDKQDNALSIAGKLSSRDLLIVIGLVGGFITGKTDIVAKVVAVLNSIGGGGAAGH